jgi:hypothetical protein
MCPNLQSYWNVSIVIISCIDCLHNVCHISKILSAQSLGDESLNDNSQKNVKRKKHWCMFLISHNTKRRVCKSFGMGIRTKWQIHEHLMNKSLAQTKQCKWLMKVKSTLGHGLTLNLLHSHGLGII